MEDPLTFKPAGAAMAAVVAALGAAAPAAAEELLAQADAEVEALAAKATADAAAMQAGLEGLRADAAQTPMEPLGAAPHRTRSDEPLGGQLNLPFAER